MTALTTNLVRDKKKLNLKNWVSATNLDKTFLEINTFHLGFNPHI